MTVEATPRKAGPYAGNDVTTLFAFNFKVFAEEDVQVVYTPDNGNEVTLVLNSDYSVTLNPDQDSNPGGSVTYPLFGATPPLPTGTTLTMIGDLPYNQPTDYTNSGRFLPQVVENSYDRATMQIQQLAEIANRTLQAAVGTNVTLIFPAPSSGKFLRWNSAETGLENADAGTDSMTLQGLLADSVDPTHGAGMVGFAPKATYPAGTLGFVYNFLGTRTLQNKVQETISPADTGTVANGVANDDVGFNAAKALKGAVFVPADKRLNVSQVSFNRISTEVPAGFWVSQANMWIADDSFTLGQGTINAARATSGARDAIYGEHFGSGTGYAVHGISYATNGSGGGFACWGVGSGVIGNKRGDGADSIGNGVLGTRLENADGNGVAGDKQGSGAGHGVYGTNFSAGAGAGVLGRREDGPGAGVQALKQGSGTGDGALIEHYGAGSGNGATINNGGSAAGTGVTVSRSGGDGDGVTVTANNATGMGITTTKQVGGVTRSISYMGYWDNGTGESAAIYGAAVSGTIQRAARFDGDTRTSGTAVAANANPLADNTGTVGNASFRWQAIWAATGTINTSDRNAKTGDRPLDDKERAVAAKLKGMVKMFRFVDGGGHPGQRLHVGLIAQEVQQAFADEGLDAADYALWCNDEIFEEVIEDDGFEEQVAPNGDTMQVPKKKVAQRSLGFRQGLRYDQVLAFVIASL